MFHKANKKVHKTETGPIILVSQEKHHHCCEVASHGPDTLTMKRKNENSIGTPFY